jgi:hypothetical protein
MSWVLTASGSVAAPPGFFDGYPAGTPRAEQRRLERAEIADAAGGAELRLTAGSGGVLQASLAAADVDVSKVVQPSGDFQARITGRQDLVVVARMGNRLHVSRGDRTVAVFLDRADEAGLDLVQQLLAGSHAVRAYRAVHRRLNRESLESAPGVALDNLDALLGILQGESGAVDRRAPRRVAGARLSRAALGHERSCYSEYETEVVTAWDDYAQCIDDVKWYPGLQEVCAFTWLLRAESAWFRFIGCSSIPLKMT